MKWQEFVKDYLSFTRKERIGVLFIAVIMFSIFFAPVIVSMRSKKEAVKADTAWFSAVRKLEKKNQDTSRNYYSPDNEESNNYVYQFDKTKTSRLETRNNPGELFNFDPNTLNFEGWTKLGVREKTIQTIQNYLSKGGKFRKPEDLQKVYGLREDEYDKLASFIKIADATEVKRFESDIQTNNVILPKKSFTSGYSVIDINESDTAVFISLPGIGSKLAARIVNFREKLGGFYSIEQVKETFGLPDSTFQIIKQYLNLDHPSIKKININTATVDELKAHPYIKYSLANPIIAYRNEHGPFSKVEDIKKVMAVTEEIYLKISPYLFIQ